jgi:hypothetical protein
MILILVLILLAFVGCSFENETEFVSTKYIIQAEDVQDQLNIEPVYIYSSDESVAIGEIDEEGNIVITSKKMGWASIIVADFVGGSNSARIEVNVEGDGKIIANISKFFGQKVVAVVKEKITITGRVDAEIPQADIRLMMDNNDFIVVAINKDVSSWITNLPRGLAAKISYLGSGEHLHEITITVSGIPKTAYTGTITITIPRESSASTWEVFVASDPDVKFEINSAGQ